MPFWLLPIIEFFGKIALKVGLKILEAKYPGSKTVIDLILKWLEGQAAQGNQQAVAVLNEHVAKLCDGVGCPADLKGI